LKYSRKTEFRKLCDKLRKHLEDIQKLTPQVANVSISKPETQQLNQDTRLVQLDSAIQMELWQVCKSLLLHVVLETFIMKNFKQAISIWWCKFATALM
jgi:DNA-directed RNA polymerase alpha subunit